MTAKSSRKSVHSNTSSSTLKKNLYTAETTLTPVRKKIVVDVGRPAKKPKFNIDEETDKCKDDSISEEMKRDDFQRMTSHLTVRVTHTIFPKTVLIVIQKNLM